MNAKVMMQRFFPYIPTNGFLAHGGISGVLGILFGFTVFAASLSPLILIFSTMLAIVNLVLVFFIIIAHPATMVSVTRQIGRQMLLYTTAANFSLTVLSILTPASFGRILSTEYLITSSILDFSDMLHREDLSIIFTSMNAPLRWDAYRVLRAALLMTDLYYVLFVTSICLIAYTQQKSVFSESDNDQNIKIVLRSPPALILSLIMFFLQYVYFTFDLSAEGVFYINHTSYRYMLMLPVGRFAFSLMTQLWILVAIAQALTVYEYATYAWRR